jgi:hypothetical protein
MKTGYMKYDTTTYGNVEIAEIAAGDMFAVSNDCGIYNIIFKKPLLNIENEVCGAVYVHAPNCTLDNGKYIVHKADESRITIAYHQLCDLAHVLYDTSCYDLFKALNTVLYSDDYKSNPNRAERQKKE